MAILGFEFEEISRLIGARGSRKPGMRSSMRRRTAICGYAAHGLRSLPIPRRTPRRPPLRINNVWKVWLRHAGRFGRGY